MIARRRVFTLDTFGIVLSAANRRHLIYWATQLCAWGALVVLLASLAYANDEYKPGVGLVLTLVLVLGIAVSHLYRAMIQRLKWLQLSIGALIPRLALGALLLGFLAFAAQAVLHDLFLPFADPLVGSGAVETIGGMINWMVLLFIWGMGYFSYHWFARSRREEIRNLRLEGANRENQLGNLRAQLNPHFMFNALNGIRALIDEDPARAKQAITQLSAILRNSMTTMRRDTVPLGEELDMVKAYLDLEAMRFEERLQVNYDVEPGLEREPVPPMMLQTLAENAVRHGIAHIIGGGRVEVGAHRTLDGLLLTVKNTGNYDPHSSKKTGATNGIGLHNTRRRLHILYGPGAALRIQNRDGMVVTEVEIPSEGERVGG